jgi:hypothetical protein
MSDPILRIDRLHTVCRIPAGGDPEPLRAQVEAAGAGAALCTTLDRLLPGTLAALGLDADAEVAVQRLDVRLRVRNEVSAATIAGAWADAIARALHGSLEAIAARGGGVTDEIALFEDRAAAERSYVQARFLGETEAWWWRPILGRGGPVPSAREVISAWIRALPERAPSLLGALAREPAVRVERALSEIEARALTEELLASGLARLAGLQAAAPPLVRGPAQRSATSPRAAWGSGARDAGSRIDDEARRAAHETAALASLHPLLEAAELEALTRARGPAARRLLAVCFLLARRPAALTLLAAPAAEPASSAPPIEPAALARGPSPPGQSPTLDAPGRAGDAPDDLAPARRSTRALDPGGEAAPHEHRVGCGGLLFLVRRIAASSLLDDHRGPALEERLVALGLTALHRALAALPEGARRAACERERPVLTVFTGVTDLPELLHIVPVGPAARAAEALLDALAAALPADLAPCPDGLLATYGSEPAPFAPDAPHRALAHLLLRPGRLVLTPTRADLHFPARAVDVGLRLGGWDIDPGWAPHLGRIIRFHYEER